MALSVASVSVKPVGNWVRQRRAGVEGGDCVWCWGRGVERLLRLLRKKPRFAPIFELGLDCGSSGEDESASRWMVVQNALLHPVPMAYTGDGSPVGSLAPPFQNVYESLVSSASCPPDRRL